MARGQLRHLARAHQHRGLVAERIEDLARETHRDRADRDRAVADQGGLAHAFGDLKGLVKCAMEHQPDRRGLRRLRVCEFQLAKNLRLANDHRVEARADAKQMADRVAPAEVVQRLVERGAFDLAIRGEEARDCRPGALSIRGDADDLDAIAGREQRGLADAGRMSSDVAAPARLRSRHRQAARGPRPARCDGSRRV